MITVTQIQEGRPVQVGKPSRRRTVLIDREWRVEDDGQLLGYIRYGMVTHERRSGQRTYVDARWESPGWKYQYPGGLHWFTETAKKHCLEKLARG